MFSQPGGTSRVQLEGVQLGWWSSQYLMQIWGREERGELRVESGLIDQSDKNVVLIFDVLHHSLSYENISKHRSPYLCLFLINVFT